MIEFAPLTVRRGRSRVQNGNRPPAQAIRHALEEAQVK